MTIKLYLKNNRRVVEYHEAFVYEGKIHQHWGPLGGSGASSSRARNRKVSIEQDLNALLASARSRGFAEIPIEDHSVVLVEYAIHEMGTPRDLDKITALFDVLQDILGNSGLGHCDGHSIGSGTMEAACFVVDAAIAARVIAEGLKGTAFADFTRIYEEDGNERGPD